MDALHRVLLAISVLYLPLITTCESGPPQGEASRRAIAYLEHEYNADVGLVRESPKARPYRHFLATDNRLVTYAVEDSWLTDAVSTTLNKYQYPRHGLIEVMRGERVDWPPYVETQCCTDAIGKAQVWVELKNDGAGIDWPSPAETERCIYAGLDEDDEEEEKEEVVTCEASILDTRRFHDDWWEYADLALLGALCAHYHPDCLEGTCLPSDSPFDCHTDAAGALQAALDMFDGTGFLDKPHMKITDEIQKVTDCDEPFCETYKLALAVYVINIIGEPLDDPSILSRLMVALMAKQQDSGGFVTLYDAKATPQGDTNTETTAYAILALQSAP